MNQIKQNTLLISIVVCVLQLISINSRSQFTSEENVSISEIKNSVQSNFTLNNEISNAGKGNVELYTGRARYTIPIYNLKSYDIEVPIMLSYISAGVKIQQLAGWVGIDWNLQPGGIIKRELKGLPDELPSKGYFEQASTVNNFYNDLLTAEQKRAAINNNDVDYQPDIFYFNIGKYSGSFIFDANKKIHFFPYQNIKAQEHYVSNKLAGFTLTTADGMIYKFGNSGNLVEETLIETETYIWGGNAERKTLSDDFYTSAWYLYKIQSPLGDEVEFKYSDSKLLRYVDASKTIDYRWKTEKYDNVINEGTRQYVYGSYVYNHDQTTPIFYNGNWLREQKDIDYPYYFNFSTYTSQNRYEIKRRYLSEIICKSGYKASFIVEYNREDLPNSGKLKSIEIFNSLNSSIKKVNLEYNNVTSKYLDPTGNSPDPFSELEASVLPYIVKINWDSQKAIPANIGIDYISQHDGSWSLDFDNFMKEGLKHYNYNRLFLSKVTETNGIHCLNYYSFTYIKPDELQRRTSNYVDFYGYNINNWPETYYDGTTQSQKLKFQYTKSYPNNDEYVRKKVSNVSQSGLLQKVESKTGEELEYYYDNNNSKAGSRVTQLKRTDKNQSISTYYNYLEPEVARMDYDGENFFYQEYDKDDGDYSVCLKFAVTINSSGNLSTENSLFNGSPIIYNNVEVFDDAEKLNGYNNFIFYSDLGNISEKRIVYSPKIYTNRPWHSDVLHQSGEGWWTHYYQEYDYTQFFEDKNPFGFPGTYFYLNNGFKRGILKENIAINSSGKKVKQINYNYSFGITPPDESAIKINGLIGSNLKVGIQWDQYWVGEIYKYDWYLERMNGYIATLYSLTPETYQLDNVTEKIYNSNSPGVEDYVLEKTTNYTYNNLGQVETMNITDSKNDEIQTKYTYPADIPFVDATAYILGNTLTSGSQLIIDFDQTIQVELLTPPNVPAGAAGNTLTLCFNGSSNRNIIFYDIGTKSLDLPKGSYSVNIPDGAGGRINIYYKKYSSTGIKAMVDKNMISTPVKIKTRNTTQAKSLIDKNTSFRIDNPSDPEENWRVVPSAYTEKLTTESVNAKHIIYDKYDSYGNLLQFHKANDINNSYVWGYNGQYPIASVVNAMNQEIFFTSFEGEEEDLIDFVIDKRVSTRSHSGEKSLEYTLSDPSQSVWERRYELFKLKPVASDLPKKYRYSGWVYSNGPKPNVSLFFKKANGVYNSTSNATTTATNQWTYVEGEYTLPAAYNGSAVTDLTLWVYGSDTPGKIWFDDLRLYPADAQMTSYTYKPLVGMTSQTDPNGKTTIYDYDSFGRLRLTKDHKNNIMERYEYNYKFDQTYIEPPTPAEFVFNELNVSPTDPENGKVLVNVKYFNNGGSYGSINPTLVVESYDCSSGAYNGSGNIIFDEPLSISAAGQSYGGFTNEFTLDNGCYVFKVLDEATIIDFFELNLTSVTQ